MNVNGLSSVPTGKPNKKPVGSTKEQMFQELWPKVLQEARAVSLWSFVALLFRLFVVLLVTIAAYKYDNTALRSISPALHDLSEGSLYKELWITISVICGLILSIAPTKVLTNQSPGFVFANPWILLWIRDKTTIIPNLAVRVCEYMLGRISLMELVALLPIHFVAMLSTSVFVRQILPGDWSTFVVEPIEYSNKNAWLDDLLKDTMITACFTVGIMVLPVLFRLNYVPRWMTTFAMYPVFNFAVDGSGMASSFTPNVVLSLGMLESQPLAPSYRIASSVLGGIVGGKIMQHYFPDDDPHRTSPT